MKNKNKLIRLFKLIYIKLFRIHDTPQKIALGFGLGIFLGILPGSGPIAALCLAFLFKLNRVSALLGSLLTNTWLSFLIFPLSIKAGSTIINLSWQDIYSNKVILPAAIGYLTISFCLGVFGYLVALIMLKQIKKYKQLKQK